jgi:hypothetical protein
MGEGAMTEPTDAELLAKVNEALQILEVQLASAEATEAAAGRRLADAEARVATLAAEPQWGTETASVVGMPSMNGGGSRYTATPPSVSTRPSSVIFGIRLKRGQLLRVRTTLLERLGTGGMLTIEPEAKP